MIHPLLTAVFDTFLIGSAGAVIAAMVEECREERKAVGASSRALRRPATVAPRAVTDVHRLCGSSRSRKFRLSVG